jgi:hypothetical protein
MTTVFIGGSRRITRLNQAVAQRLNTIAEKQIPVLVGDANGADKVVQAYLRGEGYERVTVYCTGDVCRNNLGNWPVTHVEPRGNARRRNRRFFTLKDRAMSSKATHGLMLWDGTSLGTLVNIVRLRREGRPTVVYVQPNSSFVDVKDDEDLAKLVEYGTTELLSDAEQVVAAEMGESIQKASSSANLMLF